MKNKGVGGDYEKACSKAFACLGRKARTRAELEEKLADAGFSSDIIADVSDMLIRCNYINDEAYACDYVEYAMNVKKFGRMRIIQELRKRGIESETAKRAMSKAEAEMDGDLSETELAMALEHLEYRTRGERELDWKERKRCADYLIRRGFTFETAKRAIETYMRA